jgi:hypothetical protein
MITPKGSDFFNHASPPRLCRFENGADRGADRATDVEGRCHPGVGHLQLGRHLAEQLLPATPTVARSQAPGTALMAAQVSLAQRATISGTLISKSLPNFDWWYDAM